MAEPNPGRRRFLLGSASLAAGLAGGEDAASAVTPLAAEGADDAARVADSGWPLRGVIDTSASPHVVLRSVGLPEARWTTGFWADRFATCERNMIPTMWRIMQGTDHSQFFENFRIAAGLAEGRHRGPAWNDGDFYKWLEGAASVYAITKDADLERRLSEVIAVVGQAQRADGYLHTPVLIKNRNGDQAAQPFQDRLDFEMYNLGHLMTAACVHHRATGKTNLLAIATKAADFLVRAFRSPTPQLARQAVCPSHYMGIVELYRTTRNPTYLELARKLLALRDQVADGSDDNQDRIPLRAQTEAVGHAVRANYLYAGAADLYAETGDPELLAPVLATWENMVTRKMFITGGCGALYDGASPDGSSQQKSIGRVHQAYGRNYQLPNSTAHNETCASVASALWSQRLLQITGEARFADVLERVLYNAAGAGMSLDGTQFFYVNTLRQLDQMPVPLRWSRARQPFISCFCCPPNLLRLIAESAQLAYGRSEDAIWVHLFGGSILDTEIAEGARVRLSQQTDYPWDGRVTINVEATPARAWTLRLRIPHWASDASLTLNGTLQRAPLDAGSYFALQRSWSAGDRIELSFPMHVRLMQAHPLVEEARNQVAIERGPVVYCLESTDLPRSVRVSDVSIPLEIDLKPRFDPAQLGGVCLLEGRALARATVDWSKDLYRVIAEPEPHPVDVRLIPYFAWGNRGRSEMTVWIPRG